VDATATTAILTEAQRRAMAGAGRRGTKNELHF